MYFNPPYSTNVKTNIGKEFLKLITKHFPKNHKYHKLFNRGNLKCSYSCMPNMEKIIKGHNHKVLREKPTSQRTCNCRKKNTCPLNGQCLLSCLVYKAVVHVNDVEKAVYYGSCEGTFKERYGNHKKSFKNEAYETETKLSKYVWDLKRKKEDFEIKWSVKKKCSPYQASSRRCDLCLTEKLIICRESDEKMINKRSEISNKCKHSNKFSLQKILQKRLLSLNTI